MTLEIITLQTLRFLDSLPVGFIIGAIVIVTAILLGVIYIVSADLGDNPDSQ